MHKVFGRELSEKIIKWKRSMIGVRRMIETIAESLTSFLYEAKQNAEHKQVPQLLSWTKRIDLLNIVDVFRRAKQTNQNRFFWMNHTNAFAIAGVGEAERIETADNSAN